MVLLCTCVCFGCRKSTPIAPDELDQMMSEDFCRSIIENSSMASDVRKRAMRVRSLRKNNTIDAKPVLIRALLSDRNDGLLILTLGFSDEDGDIAGITLKEEKKRGASEIDTLVESYPVWGRKELKAATYYFTPVHIRKSGERKDDGAWKEYLDGGEWTHEKRPPLWISPPEDGRLKVQVCVYDQAGNVSNYVEVENLIGN